MYGIKNCDTIKKARKWLDAESIEYAFHDYKKDGTDESLFKSWIAELGWEAVINRRGTTWRQLSDEQKSGMNDIEAVKVMLDNPSIIKRPLLDHDNQRVLGFKAETYETVFK